MIKPIHTSCKNCIFAKYDNNTQTGCHATYLDSYRNNEADILEVYDDDTEFYVINEKKCIGYRENSFFKRLDMEDSDINDKLDYLYKTNKLSYLCVVDLYDFDLDSLDQLFNNLKNQEIKPQKIIFIRYAYKPAIFGYEIIRSKLRDSELNCEWRIQTMLDKDLSRMDILHNILNINKKQRFILYVRNPEATKDITKIIDKANTVVYKELKIFNVITNTDKDCLLFPGAVYRYSQVVQHKNLLTQDDQHTVI
jgi:hypothetical protein